jgi:hypothetical protein
LGGFLIDQPISFHHMQSLGLWRPVNVDHRERPDLKPDGVYHQCVPLLTPTESPYQNGVTWAGCGWFRNFMILAIKDDDLVRLPEDLHPKIAKMNARGRRRPALQPCSGARARRLWAQLAGHRRTSPEVAIRQRSITHIRPCA